ncbi:MAG: hypothetical protein Q8L46_00610 [candidate division WWE3 bacterium]|nr:hypothetical protein [candidate division WWE3 bacterium]
MFTHTLQELLENKLLVVILSGAFFSSFHWGWNREGIGFGLLTLFLGFAFSTLFLQSPNVILLGVTHGILATLYYFVVSEENILDKRLSNKHRLL